MVKDADKNCSALSMAARSSRYLPLEGPLALYGKEDNCQE